MSERKINSIFYFKIANNLENGIKGKIIIFEFWWGPIDVADDGTLIDNMAMVDNVAASYWTKKC